MDESAKKRDDDQYLGDLGDLLTTGDEKRPMTPPLPPRPQRVPVIFEEEVPKPKIGETVLAIFIKVFGILLLIGLFAYYFFYGFKVPH